MCLDWSGFSPGVSPTFQCPGTYRKQPYLHGLQGKMMKLSFTQSGLVPDHTPSLFSEDWGNQDFKPLCDLSWQASGCHTLYDLCQFTLLQEPCFNTSCVFQLSISSVQLLSCVRLFVTPWIAACQASLSITSSRSLLKLMPIESVMPSNHLILCHPLFLLPPIPPSIRVFSSKSTLHMRWPKYCSFSFSISPFNEHPGLISFRMDWLDLLAVQGTLKSLLQHHSSKASILQRIHSSHIHTWPLEKP